MPLLRILVAIAMLAAVALADWPMYQQNPRHTGVASDTSINASNVSHLSQDWTFGTGDWVTGTPIVVNGTVYIGSWDGNFYALRESDGQRLWSVSVGRTSDNCGATYGVDATAAYSDGKSTFPPRTATFTRSTPRPAARYSRRTSPIPARDFISGPRLWSSTERSTSRSPRTAITRVCAAGCFV